MEKEILQELMYDLDREKNLNSQINLVIEASEMLCDENTEDAWEFFRNELNVALTSNKNITTCLNTLEKNLKGVKIKVIL